MFIPMLQRQFGFNQLTIQMNLEGVSDDEALATPVPGASSINWVLGHILATRCYMHQLSATEAPCSAGTMAPYNRGTSPDKDSALPLSTLLSHLARSQETLLAGLEAMSEDDMDVEVEQAPLDQKTKGGTFSALVFHEAYHAGQLGLLRRAAGKDAAIP